jgi:transcriptional regulator with XRE-family HTH domain
MVDTAPNEGARQLKATGATLREIGSIAGVSQEAVRKWLGGLTTPQPEARAKLRTKFQIPKPAWDEAPITSGQKLPPPSKQSRTREAPVTGPEPEEDTDADLALALDGPDAAREAAANHLRRVQRLREAAEKKGSATEYTRALELERKAILDFGRFNGELTPADESRLTQTPRFKAISSAIAKALLPYPEAAAAVSNALREFDG